MAIDPKYANLPGIDRDQPDVYETTDLPESEQAQVETDEANSECVEKLGISADEAHKQFKGKKLDASGIDFSDRLSKNRRTGYDAPRTEYEMVGEGSDLRETPAQKYQRLQYEIRELAEEVNQIKEKVKTDESTDSMSSVELAKQAEYLQKQLTDLHLDRFLGEQGTINLADPHGALQKRLITNLESFKKPSDKEISSADHVTYQLYYRPEQAKFSNSARMADLEQRLERVEALLGTNPDKLSALTADTSNKSLIGAVATLSARTKLLEPGQIEQIEGRMLSVNLKLTQAADKKNALENAEVQSKVTELYELVKKWDGLAETLPQVVERLKALSQLHEQALQFSQALTHLDTSQQQIQSHLKTHGDMLKQVNTTLTENMNSIKGTFDSLENRVKTLSK